MWMTRLGLAGRAGPSTRMLQGTESQMGTDLVEDPLDERAGDSTACTAESCLRQFVAVLDSARRPARLSRSGSAPRTGRGPVGHTVLA